MNPTEYWYLVHDHGHTDICGHPKVNNCLCKNFIFGSIYFTAWVLLYLVAIWWFISPLNIILLHKVMYSIIVLLIVTVISVPCFLLAIKKDCCPPEIPNLPV